MMTPPPSSTLHENPTSSYVEMNSAPQAGSAQKSMDMLSPTLSPHEVYRLRQLLQAPEIIAAAAASASMDDADANSEYSEFPETTHAWAVFAGKTNRKATKMDRIVGVAIISFQLFTYALFVAEALDDYQTRTVPVVTTHDQCWANDQQPSEESLQCQADVTNHWDACVAFFMLSIFLTPEVLQAIRAVRAAPVSGTTGTMFFASLAALEVVCAFVAATIAISYQLYIGEVTDAIEVGVGLLFVRELSARAYHGIRHKGVKQYKAFFVMLVFLIFVGFLVEAICETVFGERNGGRRR